MDFFTTNSFNILSIIGYLAFIVSIITQVTKNINILKKIPTDLQVLFVSILVCLTSYIAYSQYVNIALKWYYIAGALILSFLVAFIAMYGWSKFNDLFRRFSYQNESKS